MNALLRYHNALAYIEGLANLPHSDDYMSGRTKPALFLKRTRAFLDALGRPEKGFKYVHISGTAGKGTVTTMIHDALHASGKRVGSFTSPYVTAAIEKIRVGLPGEGNTYISPDEFADIVDELKPHIDSAHFRGAYGRPSYFEIYLGMALVNFRQKKCEWVILEVGAGGTYDATNIIEKPEVTAITSIDYDHVQILGKTLRSIADNKAGIIKKGSTFFTSEKRPGIVNMFKRTCDRVNADLTYIAPETDHQETNKKLAQAICDHIGLKSHISKKAIDSSMLPCRFEVIGKRPRIVLDGAHNRAKMQSTAANIQKLPFSRLHLVFAAGAIKDTTALFQVIAPFADSVYLTRFQHAMVPCADPKILAKDIKKYLKRSASVTMHLDLNDAFDAALRAAGADDIILVTGSFYLSGELRKRWYPETWVLSHRKSFR
ncbi:MAG: bifunctional folylpolyglutamate synthase/dihydrofolate synthase [Parcubacteria group bacterium Gr01-1014_8]|nr:MAG: bifunctional folylpolyglutamate synthase/dihydrofolate synthase [Parcubacteria group bacterium Gr01-1014_8]